MTLRPGVRVAIWGIVLFLLAAIVLVSQTLKERIAADAILQNGKRAERFVATAESSLNFALIGADVVLGQAADWVVTRMKSAEAIDQVQSQARDLLRRAASANMLVRDIAVLDRRGTTIVASRDESERLGVPLPPGFADRVLAQVTPQLVVSGPVRNFVTSQWVIFLSRSVSLPSGERLLVVAELPLQVLATLLPSTADTPGLVATIESEGGQLLVSIPPNEPGIGQIIKPALSGNDLSGEALRLPGRIDAVQSIVAARPTLYRSIVVSAGISVDTALAAWSRDRLLIDGTAATFAILIVLSALATHLQMTRLALARDRAEKAKQTLDQALESMTEGWLLCDKDDRVVAWNEQYLRFFPWLRNAIGVGVSFDRLVDIASRSILPDDAGKLGREAERRAWCEMRLSVHRDYKGTYEQPLVDGSVIHVNERRTLDGGYIVVYRDITVEERKLTRALVAADAANVAKSQFLASMSHEIRTPLNGIIGINRILLKSELDPKQRDYAETIRASAKSLLALVNDILDLSQIEAGKMRLETVGFNPLTLASEVTASLQPRAAGKKISLRLLAAPDLPLALRGDSRRLRQVLFNLIGNAVKFTDRGDVQIDMKHEPLDQNRVLLRVAIRDSGIGIAPDVLQRLFKRFTQADSTTSRRYGGSGLGLAISREIAALMNGTLAAQSEPGTGSTFTLIVPFELGDEGQLTDDHSESGMPSDLARALHVLVAEDNQINQMVIKELLNQLGHSCQVVSDGHAAIERLKSDHFDLILMDIQMPGLDGIEATRAIRALDGTVSKIPIIALTANAMVEDKAVYLTAGMNGYATKPIEPKILAVVISKVMQN